MLLAWTLMVGCDGGPTDHDRPSDSGPPVASDTDTSSTADTGSCPECPDPPDRGFLDLSATFGGTLAKVIPDATSDGLDDIVVQASSTNGAYDPTTHAGLQLWPDVVGGSPPLLIKSSHETYDDYSGTTIGVLDILSSVDATADGLRDVWVLQSDGDQWDLLSGPLLSDIEDASAVKVATIRGFRYLEVLSDIDLDNNVEVFGGYSKDVHRCSGPFTGDVDPTTCATARFDGWDVATALDTYDLDGDGIEEVLIGLDGREAGPGEYVSEANLTIVEGNYADGTSTGLAMIYPQLATSFTSPDLATMSDFDGDGYGDVAWIDRANYAAGADEGEVSVLHGPMPSGAEIHPADVTLHLVGGFSRRLIKGTPDTHGTGASFLMLISPAGVILADASGPGTFDPENTSSILAAHTAADGAFVGEFDGDNRDDIFVTEGYPGGAWLYRGAAVP